MKDAKMKLLAVGVALFTQISAGAAPVTKSATVKTTGVKTAQSKKVTKPTSLDKTLAKTESESASVLKRPIELLEGLSIGYDLATTNIEAAESALMASYSLQPGMKMVGGFSLKNPSQYSYGALEVHSIDHKSSFVPPFMEFAYQIGGGTFQDESINDGDRVTGFLLGMTIDYVVNHFASVNVSSKFIGSGFDHSEGGLLLSSGIRFKL